VSEKFKHQIGFQHQPHAKYAQVVGKHLRVTLRPKFIKLNLFNYFPPWKIKNLPSIIQIQAFFLLSY
jgi:hypothetical protein